LEVCGYYHSTRYICDAKLSQAPFLGFQKQYILWASTLCAGGGSPHPAPKLPLYKLCSCVTGVEVLYCGPLPILIHLQVIPLDPLQSLDSLSKLAGKPW